MSIGNASIDIVGETGNRIFKKLCEIYPRDGAVLIPDDIFINYEAILIQCTASDRYNGSLYNSIIIPLVYGNKGHFFNKTDFFKDTLLHFTLQSINNSFSLTSTNAIITVFGINRGFSFGYE